MRRVIGWWALSLGALAAVPVLVWGAIDPLEEGPDATDHMVELPRVDRGVEIAAGALSVVVLVAFAAAVARRSRHDPEVWRWTGSFLAAWIGLAVAAGVARVVTAGTIGANIGGGLAILFGGPIVVALLVAALNALPD